MWIGSMADEMSCPECGADVETTDDLEEAGTVEELEPKADGTFEFYGNKRDLFRCADCRKPLGVGHSRR